MDNQLPNQHLADRIAGLVNERGEKLPQDNDEKVIIKEVFEPAVEPKSISIKIATSKIAVDAKTGKILNKIDNKINKQKRQIKNSLYGLFRSFKKRAKMD